MLFVIPHVSFYSQLCVMMKNSEVVKNYLKPYEHLNLGEVSTTAMLCHCDAHGKIKMIAQKKTGVKEVFIDINELFH